MLFDLSDRSQLEITGSDRARFLHGFCTNDIKKLLPGQGCEAFVCNVHGKVLGHIFVYCAESSLWIDTVPGQEDALFNHLDRYLINEDVQLHRRSAQCRMIYVHEQELPACVGDAGQNAATELASLPLLSHRQFRVGEVPYELCRVDWLGNPGWLLASPALNLAELPRETPEQWNRLRIAAGFPIYGADITSDNLAQEVNRTDRCISFTKGCYLGQEPIARIDALGHVNKELHRLEIEGEPPGPGSPLLDPAGNTQIGIITSVATSPQQPDRSFALGYLRTKFCSSGAKVMAGTATATVL